MRDKGPGALIKRVFRPCGSTEAGGLGEKYGRYARRNSLSARRRRGKEDSWQVLRL